MMTEAQLVEKIEQANTAYWQKNDPIIDDSYYDSLVEQLRKINPNHPLVNDIGNDSIVGKKIKHDTPVLSLDKVYSWEDLVKWCRKVARNEDEMFSFSPKLDGISVDIDNGKMITRGGGELGTDITHLAPWITCRLSFDKQSVEASMLTLLENNAKYGRLVGELLVPCDKFERLKNSYPAFEKYKTPRNLASGFASLQQDSEFLNSLHYAGLPIIVGSWVCHRAKELKYPLKSIVNDKDLEKTLIKKLRNFNKFPTDGIVCRLTDDVYGESLGVTQHHPHSAMALKFKDDEYTTKVVDIVWQVGNEAITPVAVVEPINIEGVIVRRATCHNAKFVADNNLHPGSEVTIVRRGGVIPKIVKVVKEDTPFIKVTMPNVCPECGEPTQYEQPDLLCINQMCPGRCTNKIVNGLAELGVKGIGPSIVERLVRELHINNIMAFFMEAWDRDVLLAKDFTAHEIHVIMSEVDRVTNSGIDDESIFASLCIPQASRSFARLVIKYLGGIMSLVDEDPETLRKKLHAIRGINSTAADNVVDFMIEDEEGLYEAYYNLFNHKKPIDVDSRTKYCFTGALPYPRKDLEQWVMDAGGYPTDNIRQADYLVSASPASTSSKMKYAREHNIPVVSFDELMKHLSKVPS